MSQPPSSRERSEALGRERDVERLVLHRWRLVTPILVVADPFNGALERHHETAPKRDAGP